METSLLVLRALIVIGSIIAAFLVDFAKVNMSQAPAGAVP